MGLTGFLIIHVFIASFSPAQGERNQMVNAKFTRPVNALPMSSLELVWCSYNGIVHGPPVVEVTTHSPLQLVTTLSFRATFLWPPMTSDLIRIGKLKVTQTQTSVTVGSSDYLTGDTE